MGLKYLSQPHIDLSNSTGGMEREPKQAAVNMATNAPNVGSRITPRHHVDT